MKISNLSKTRKELERFTDALDEMEKAISENEYLHSSDHIYGCPQSGSLKRSSMDLTRMLAKLRGE